MKQTRSTAAIALVLMCGTALAGCKVPTSSTTSPQHSSTGTASNAKIGEAPKGSALNALQKINVAQDAKVDYDRAKLFGDDFMDLTGDGCDSRQKAYKRDLTNIEWDRGSKCRVNSGTLVNDAYVGGQFHYQRGRGSDVDIDHRVPLEDACKQGMCTDMNTKSAQQETRVKFANDPYNLITVSSAANRQKSARSIDEWEAMGKKINRKTKQPVKVLINEDRKCEYVAYIVGIKGKYNLSMTPGEKSRIEEILKTCPDQQVPVDPKTWTVKN